MKDALDSATPDLFKPKAKRSLNNEVLAAVHAQGGPPTKFPPLFDPRPQRIHPNSRAAYRDELPRMSHRAAMIYSWLKQHAPATDRQVMVGLGFTDMNAVRPRITELLEMGVLWAHPESRRDPMTGKSVRVVVIR
jgi:hypothetical protein